MPKIKSNYLLKTLLFICLTTHFSLSFSEEKLPYILPPNPETDAESYILIDADSGRVLAEKLAYETRFPASLTKIMTAYVAFKEIAAGNIDLEDQILISENAWKTGGSRSFIKVNHTYTLEQLLKAMIVQSGNDSAVAIAEFIAGDEGTFSQLMNMYAEKLGLSSTNFANSTGLPDPDEYTSAYDMAKLSNAMIKEFPIYYQWYAIKELEINGIKQYNRNKLLWRDIGVDGIKTGYTKEAGYNLVVSAVKNDMRLISVVMKATSTTKRETDSYKLLNYGFRFFETIRIFEAQSPIQSINLKDAQNPINLSLKEDTFITIGKNRSDLLSYEYKLNPNLQLPINQADIVGVINILFNGELLETKELIALNQVNKANLIQKIKNWFNSFFSPN